MRESHSEQHPVDQLLNHAPKFRLNHEASTKILKEINQEAERVKVDQRRYQRLRTASIGLSFGILILLLFSVFPKELDSLLQLQPKDHIENKESWEISVVNEFFAEEENVFDYKEGIERGYDPNWAIKYIGVKNQYGLGVSSYENKVNGSKIAVFDEGNPFKSKWYIFQPYHEIQDQMFSVMAQSYATGEKIEFVPETKVTKLNNITMVESRCSETGCRFTQGGYWKLFLYLDQKPIGEIVINVRPKSSEDREKEERLNQFLWQLLQDVAQSFEIDLNTYKYLDWQYLYINDDKYGSLLILQDETVTYEKGEYRSFIILNHAEDQGYILQKKKDGTNIIYQIRKNQQDVWELVSSDSKPGQVMSLE